MIKRIIVVLLIVSFMLVSTFAVTNIPVNSDNTNIKKNEVSKSVVSLTDQELVILNGQGWWACAGATVTWTALVMGSPAGFPAGKAAYSLALAAAFKAMVDECNYLKNR